jgi:phosphoglycerate dehydrogenase-like enzyme
MAEALGGVDCAPASAAPGGTAAADLTVVLHPASNPGVRAALESLGRVHLLCPGSPADVAGALAASAGEVLVTPRGGWSDRFLVPGLRWVQSQSAGMEGFPLAEFRRRGIAFSTGRGLHDVCAEHALALLLALTRDVHAAVRDMTGRRWRPHVAQELAGRTVTVAGLGTIGSGVVRRLRGWNVRIIGLTRSADRHADLLQDVRPLSSLRMACRESSALILALPGGADTRHLVAGPELDALGAGWLVNVSRGSVVDESALVARLTSGGLLGAGLDVVESEPLPADSPLWGLSNVIITPHMAGRTPRYPERFAVLMAHNVRAYRGEGEWLNKIC